MAEQKKTGFTPREMTEEEQARFQEWVKNKARGGPTCSVCGSTSWYAHPQYVELRPFGGGSLMFAGTIIPAVLLLCRTCANMLLINALGSGVMLRESLDKPVVETKPEAKKTSG